MISMKKLITALSLLLFLASCKKEVSELPPATETGANTFGAKVDGQFWVPQGFGIMPTNEILDAHFIPERNLYINARNFASSPNETEFEIYIKSVTAPGTYLLNMERSGISNSYAYFVKRNINPVNEWVTSPQYTGTVTITKIDSVSRFVSGTFQFSAINLYNDPQPLSVTDGRFDVKY